MFTVCFETTHLPLHEFLRGVQSESLNRWFFVGARGDCKHAASEKDGGHQMAPLHARTCD